MFLTLEIADPPAELQEEALKEFGQEGGTIGRHEANTWVLPDVTVSGEHAKITFADGAFFIEDTSMNGVFVASDRERLVAGRPSQLASGDELVIGPFEIRVSVTPGEGDADQFAPVMAVTAREDEPIAIESPGSGVVDEPLPEPAAGPEYASPPAVTPPPPSRQDTPERSAATPTDLRHVDDLALVLAELDLADLPATPELGRAFGRILRVVVSGAMDLLQARQHFKDEFRMDQTLLRPQGNNPLKFSVDADQAVRDLLVRSGEGGYLDSAAAFEDAFKSLRNHHVAALTGMRAAFDATLAEFDPEELEKEFDRTPAKGLRLRLLANRRYWELYREKVDALVADPDTTFRTLFGATYTDAYEEQIDKL